MKKNLLFVFLILFVLSTSAFAGFNDPKKDSDKPAVLNTRENKLSNEELSRITRRAETDNLSEKNLVNKGSSDSNKDLRATTQVIVETRHHRGGYGWYGGGGLLLVIILVIILV
ncbi:MAG: hypothetical protein ABR927_02310 [Bacteroidales bacterium]|jgi:hypothetical protein